MIEIQELQKEEETTWESYIHKSSTSTFYHQIGWKSVVEKTYTHKPIYLIAKEEGVIRGVSNQKYFLEHGKVYLSH